MSRLKKSLFKFIFKLLPAWARQSLMRSMIRVQDQLEEGYVVKIAETREEFAGAFRVLHDSYVEKGFCNPQPSGLRLIHHHALPTTSVLVAKQGDRVVGTLTLVRDNRLKLPIEKEWDLSKLRGAAGRIAEITCFAIDPAFRRASHGNVFFPLLRFMYMYATNHFGTNCLAVVIDPKDRDFYEGLLFFEPVDDRVVEDYLGAPAIAQFLDLKQANARFQKAYAQKPKHRDLFRYFILEESPKGFQFPTQAPYAVNGPTMSAELVRYFFFEASTLGVELTSEQIDQLLFHFPGEFKNRACRIDVELPAELLAMNGSVIGRVQIKDISKTGLRMATTLDPVFLSLADLRLRTLESSGIGLDIRVRPVWSKAGHGVGLAVLPDQILWQRWVQKVESELPSGSSLLLALKATALASEIISASS